MPSRFTARRTLLSNVFLSVALNKLTVSNAAPNSTVAWSATISNNTSGSNILAFSSDGTSITISGNTISATFATAGTPTITLIEVHPKAAGPSVTLIPLTVTAVAIPMTISGSFQVGTLGTAYNSSLTVTPANSPTTISSGDISALAAMGLTFTGTTSPTVTGTPS